MRRQQSVRIGDILDAYIPPESTLGRGLLTAKVSSAYRQVVGAAATEATMKLTYRDGALRCKISSSMFRMHLSANKDEILKAINEILGKEEVKSLIFT